MGTLVLTPYKPAPATPGDANQIANGFTAIEASVNSISQAQMAAGNKVTASAMSGGPPASPSDGDIWIALAVDANGTVWQFRYNAGSASAFKWEFIGGPATTASLAADESTATSGAWADLTTAGPKITVARAGDYVCSAQALVYDSSATTFFIGIANGAVNPNDPLIAQAAGAVSVGANVGVPMSIVEQVLLSVTAATDIRLRYFYNAATGHAIKRTLSIVPVRIA